MEYQRRNDGHPLYLNSEGALVPIDNYALAHYGKIPQAIEGLFQYNLGWQVPVTIKHWKWSTTFNRWSAFVLFDNQWEGYTYPKTS